MELGKRQQNPAGNGECLAALKMQEGREGMAEYSAQADGNNQQFRKSEVEVSDKDEREPLRYVEKNSHRASLDIAGTENIDRARVAITVFTDVFI